MINKNEPDTGIVVIGRNEGERLLRCLRSLEGYKSRLVYVDSGSNDGSRDFAGDFGAVVVDLDVRIPFTAARARNEGVKALLEMGNFSYVQFVDGDCEMEEDWITIARRYLEENKNVAAVGGRLRERNPEHSIYNRFCAIEWNTPMGEVQALGGIAMFRVSDFISAGRFNESLAAGEEPELCLRIRRSGKNIVRIENEMAKHDAHLVSFTQWWARMKRTGYGSSAVVTMLLGSVPVKEIPFYHIVKSTRRWSLMWAVATLFFLAIGGYMVFPCGAVIGLSIGCLVWLAQAFRIGWHMRHRTQDLHTALIYGVFTLIGKWAQLVGLIKYKREYRRRSNNRK